MTYSTSNFISVSKKLVLLTFISVAFFNCKNKEEKPIESNTSESIKEEVVMKPTLEKGCYGYNQNADMVNLEITKASNPVEGNLTYAYAEKDKNSGTFKGEFKDGKLIALYTFQSEGIESTRQVAFLLKNQQLIEGYGEMNDDGTMFKNVASLKYTSTMPLVKKDCEH